jgi:acyl carrier protein
VTHDQIRVQVLDALREVAPEADLDRLVPDRPLRDQLDLDSYDFLNFLLGVHQRLGVDIPERDYSSVPTLARLIDYLEARQGPS